ncbi:MAG: Clp protease N-terminal domain-containing protein [bacterium]|nr:Clp protease N-terminal domain-containing protein [bacterium]
MDKTDNLEKFTPRARQVMALAAKQATQRKHNFVGTEHLILGLTGIEGECSAGTVLESLGISLEEVKQEVEKLIQPGPEAEIGLLTPPLTPRTKKVLSLANKERQILKHKTLGTEHILLGILREGDGLAARVLLAMKVELETARQAVSRLRPAEQMETGEELNLPELFRTAEELMENPLQKLRLTPRVLAAICTVNQLECSDNEREDLFLSVLAHLRGKSKESKE